MQDVPPPIENSQALQALCEELGQADFVAIDTEFVRERTYYPQLCLIQLATDSRLALIDARADLELDPLLEVLARPDLVKVLHAARQDLEIFYFLAGAVPGPVFDSQIAAACLGYGEQLSYSKLAEALLGIEPGKSHARTDWTRRPLAPEQLSYAADDVRFLVTIYHHLARELSEKNREHWLEDAFGRLTDPQLYAPQPDAAYKRVRGTRAMKPAAQARLVGLAAWREELAMRKDRPRRWILSDETLVALATSDGLSADALHRVPGLPAKLRDDQGEAILGILDNGERAAPVMEQAAPPPTAAENKLIKRLSATVREEAQRLGTSPALLATRSELARLVREDDPDQPLLRNWRREVIGEKLMAIKLEKPAKTG